MYAVHGARDRSQSAWAILANPRAESGLSNVFYESENAPLTVRIAAVFSPEWRERVLCSSEH